MAGRARKKPRAKIISARGKPDEKLAHKIAKEALRFIQGLLVFVGKPFFYLLSRLFLAFLFIIYWLGHSTRVFLTGVFGLLLKLLVKFFLGLKLLIYAIHKIKLPKIKFPRLTFLRARLLLIRLRPRLVFGVGLILFLFLIFYFSILKGLPSPNQLIIRGQEVSTKIYDREGILLYKIYKNKNRTPVPLTKIPLHVRQATLAAEDAEFYQHLGFSVRGIIRSIIRNIKKGELTGGSTITQQLVKNALLTSEKTITRKIRELILSVGTEFAFSKDQILEMYLNEVSYGGTAYGIEEASQLYFGKNVEELTLGEAALLAGLPKSPTKFSPFGQNPGLTSARQKDVLALMRVNGFITKEQEEKALQEKITFAENKIDIKAPHFVMYVKELLEEKYGKEVVEKGGLEVMTTLDYSIQKLAEEVVKKEIERLTPLNVTNGASLVLNPQTGEILAMVGSKDYFDMKKDGNVNVTTSPRQPGSSIKVVNYSYALSHGYTPASIISDSPVSFVVRGQPPYSPQNYDGAFKRNLTLRSALAESRNIPAVRVLASYGVSKMIEQGKKMGITTWEDTSRFGLSLTLGGGEVKLIDLARVYATIANYGKKPDIFSITKIIDYQGRVLEENDCLNKPAKIELTKLFEFEAAANEALENRVLAKTSSCQQESVVDPRVAFLITDILRDNHARAPAFGNFSQLVIPNHQEVAVKTGTSNNLRDNLTLGYNQKYLVAVWVGNNDNSPMSRVASGVTGASPIFSKIMSSLLANEPNHDWIVPTGLVKSQICFCSPSSTDPTQPPTCQTKKEWFLEENKPAATCSPPKNQAPEEANAKKEEKRQDRPEKRR